MNSTEALIRSNSPAVHTNIRASPIDVVCRAVVAGKFGEFLQGVFSDGSPLLVTATLSDGVTAVSAETKASKEFGAYRGSWRALKAEKAVRKFLSAQGLDPDLTPGIELVSRTPMGKGQGSSSQDMTAAVLVAAKWHTATTTAREIFRISCRIERSDFLLRPNRLTQADPTTGYFQDLAAIPPSVIIGWDDAPRGEVNTEGVAHLDRNRKVHAAEYEALLQQLQTGSFDDLCKVSSRSAALSQRLLPKRSYSLAQRIAADHGGGVLVAHTGTVIGVLLQGGARADYSRLRRVANEVRASGRNPAVYLAGV